MSPRWLGGIVLFFCLCAFMFGIFDVLSGSSSAIFGATKLATLNDMTAVEGAQIADPSGGTTTSLDSVKTVLNAVKEAVSFDYVVFEGEWVYAKYILLTWVSVIVIIALALVLRRIFIG